MPWSGSTEWIWDTCRAVRAQSAPEDAVPAVWTTEQVVPWVGATVTTQTWSEVFSAIDVPPL